MRKLEVTADQMQSMGVAHGMTSAEFSTFVWHHLKQLHRHITVAHNSSVVDGSAWTLDCSQDADRLDDLSVREVDEQDSQPQVHSMITHKSYASSNLLQDVIRGGATDDALFHGVNGRLPKANDQKIPDSKTHPIRQINGFGNNHGVQDDPAPPTGAIFAPPPLPIEDLNSLHDQSASQASTCSCGNTFMPDAVFCRKCGKSRKEIDRHGEKDDLSSLPSLEQNDDNMSNVSLGRQMSFTNRTSDAAMHARVRAMEAKNSQDTEEEEEMDKQQSRATTFGWNDTMSDVESEDGTGLRRAETWTGADDERDEDQLSEAAVQELENLDVLNEGAAIDEAFRVHLESLKGNACGVEAAEECVCGNTFTANESFCRKCGKERLEKCWRVCRCGEKGDASKGQFCGKCGSSLLKGSILAAPTVVAGDEVENGDGDGQLELTSAVQSLQNTALGKSSSFGAVSVAKNASALIGRDMREVFSEGSPKNRCLSDGGIADRPFLESRTEPVIGREKDKKGIVFEVMPIWNRSLEKHRQRGLGRKKANEKQNTERNSSLGSIITSITATSPALKGRLSVLSMDSSASTLKKSEKKEYVPSIMIKPSSFRHLLWETLGLLAIACDIFVVPMEFFEIHNSSFFFVVSWFVRAYWSCNFCVSFIMGYLDSAGSVIANPRKVAWNYMKSWFLLDILILGCDWSEYVFRRTIVKGAGLVRAARLFRIFRARNHGNILEEHIRSEEVLLIAGMLKVVGIISLFIHLSACAFYAVGKMKPTGWVRTQEVYREAAFEKYMWSMHWSLVAFSGDTVFMPNNFGERLYTCVALFSFIVVAAALVSKITTAMTRLQIMSSEQSKHFFALRRFLRDNMIPRTLAVKVQRNAKFAFDGSKKNNTEESIDLLKLVSDPLMAELHFELHMRHLSLHPFFGRYSEVNLAGMRNVCHQAISFLNCQEGDILFSEFEVPVSPQMKFLNDGKFFYIKGGACPESIKAGTWVAEGGLWTKWQHQGRLMARTDSRVMILDAVKFAKVVHSFPSIHPRFYATLFVSHLNASVKASELTDIGGCSKELAEMVEITFDEYTEMIVEQSNLPLVKAIEANAANAQVRMTHAGSDGDKKSRSSSAAKRKSGARESRNVAWGTLFTGMTNAPTRFASRMQSIIEQPNKICPTDSMETLASAVPSLERLPEEQVAGRVTMEVAPEIPQ